MQPSDDPPSRVIDKETALPPNDIERYSRQLLLPQFGLESQANIGSGRILIIGLGGLGCPAALYLAGAGVGTLGLVDRPQDVVEKSNLHRQVAHTEDRVGMNKVQSAAIAIRALNSSVHIVCLDKIVPANAIELVSDYDVVLDCTDNVISRYLISDACATTRTPLVSGSAIGMEGQLTVYASDEQAPCYRCIFPRPPPPSCVGSCDSAGVLGPVPGTIGTLQALEALKLLGKIRSTSSLTRTLLLFDAAESRFRSMKLRARMSTCAVCGEKPIVEVATFDYEKFSLGGGIALPSGSTNGDGKNDPPPDIASSSRLTVEAFCKLRKEGSTKYRLIDVRPKHEFAMCHLQEAENWPLDSLRSPKVLTAVIERNIQTIFICRRGNASKTALQLSLAQGASNTSDVEGGLQQWHYRVDHNFPLY